MEATLQLPSQLLFAHYHFFIPFDLYIFRCFRLKQIITPKNPWPVSSISWEKWGLMISRRRMLETRKLMIGFRSRPPGTRNGGTLHSIMWPPWLGLASSVSLTPWQGLDGMFHVSFIPKNGTPSAFTSNINALLSWNSALILFTEIFVSSLCFWLFKGFSVCG